MFEFRKLFLLVYAILSLFPDFYRLKPWFRGICFLRARALSLCPGKNVGSRVKIYRGMAIGSQCEVVIGDDVTIKEGVRIGGTGSLTVGSKTVLLAKANIDASGVVSIGENSHIGRENHIFSHNHDVKDIDQLVNFSSDVLYKTSIGNNVMLYSNCAVMPGVSVADNSVVGFGTVVSKDTNDGEIIVGSAQRVIGMRRK